MKRGFSNGVVVGVVAGAILAGGSAMAASNLVQAQLGQSVFSLNGSQVESAPKLIYGGTTYVQLYSIQQALKQAGIGAAWDGSKSPGVFSITTVGSTSTGSSGSSGNSSPVVGVSKLPYTYKSTNGMQITVNSITTNSSGTVINVTFANNGNAVGQPGMNTLNSSIAAGGQRITFQSMDDSINLTDLQPGQSATGNMNYEALPTGATQLTLYYDLWSGDTNEDQQHITFDLTK